MKCSARPRATSRSIDCPHTPPRPHAEELGRVTCMPYAVLALGIAVVAVTHHLAVY